MSEALTTLSYARQESRTGVWPHRLAIVLLVGTFLLIIAGGNVTSKGAGLAVPDWPLSFGSFNPQGWTGMPLVRDEHFHRLAGATVGLMTVILTVWLGLREPRAWVRRLAYVALAAVIVQGLMGGFRVTQLSLTLAIVHGCFGQAFLCMVLALAMVTSPAWPEGRLDRAVSEEDRSVRFWTIALALSVYGQLVLGALLRHTGTGSIAIWHIAGALLIGACLMQASAKVFARPAVEERLSRPMIGLFLLFGLQVLLGVVTYILVLNLDERPPGGVAAYMPTAHVAVGAVILATGVYLAIRAYVITGREMNDFQSRLPGRQGDSSLKRQPSQGARA